jgi:hypothetical protein
MSNAAEHVADGGENVVWAAVSISPDGRMSQFAHTRSEEGARVLSAHVLAKLHSNSLCWGIARAEFVTHAPPRMPPEPDDSAPVPRCAEPLSNPFSATLQSLSEDHPWVPAARELESIFDAQAKRERPTGSDHARFGEGSALWGYIHLNSARQLQEFVMKASEREARDFAASLPGLVPGLDSYRYPSIGVARVEFVTWVPPVGPYEPMKNPFTELLRTQSVRSIAPDLLPSIHQLESIFDTNEKARRVATEPS